MQLLLDDGSIEVEKPLDPRTVHGPLPRKRLLGTPFTVGKPKRATVYEPHSWGFSPRLA